MVFDTLPDFRTELESEVDGGGYHLRPLTEADRDGMRAVAADPLVWAQSPANDRGTPGGFARYFDFLLRSGTLAIIAGSGEVAGCSRYYTVPDMPDTISIGYTVLARSHWGGTANKVVKSLMLDHAFVSYPDVWFHIDPNNFRSQKATAKLGARYEYDAVLDLGAGALLWKCYRLSQIDWAEAR